MSSSALNEKLVREYGAVAAVLPDTVLPKARRRAALESILSRGLPSVRDENWHYANLRGLERAPLAPAAAGGAAADAMAPELAALAAGSAPLPGFRRVLVLDGVMQVGDASSAELSVTSARAAAGAPAHAAGAGGEADPDGRFALLNEAFALDEIEIATRPPVATPAAAAPVGAAAAPAAGFAAGIEIVYLTSGRGAAYPRLTIEVRAGTRLRVLERHLGGGAATFSNGVTRVVLGAEAELEHFRIQGQWPESTWIDTVDVEVGRRSTYALHQYGVGARAARSTLRVRLAGPEASVVLHSAALASAQQTQDCYARIEHAAPHTRSRQNFRAIASGRGRVAFNGHVVVDSGAHGTDSRQSLRSLVAGPDAEVDARPQLEIYTDDVQCSHGATAGKLDETMLFYLLSRGIDRAAAQSLLKWAFLEDTIAHVADVPLRRLIEATLAAALEDPTVAAGRA